MPIGKEIPASEIKTGGTRGDIEEVRPDRLPDLPNEIEAEPVTHLSASDRAEKSENNNPSNAANHQNEDIPDFNGWAGSANYWHNDGEEIGYFYCRWKCPSEPNNQNTDATHFFFPGLQNDGTPHNILQPVLEWNNGNGPNWMMRSWYGGDDGFTHTSSIDVNEGDLLEGAIFKNSDGTWTINGFNLDTGEGVTIDTEVFDNRGEFREAVTAFEMYDFPEGECDKLPASCYFTDFTLNDGNDNDITPAWSVRDEENIGCSLSVEPLESKDEIHIHIND